MQGRWSIHYVEQAQNDLKKIDKSQAKRIIKKLEEYALRDNPKAYAKALTGKYSGKHRFRVGSYRAIVQFEDEAMIILALRISKRADIYKVKLK